MQKIILDLTSATPLSYLFFIIMVISILLLLSFYFRKNNSSALLEKLLIFNILYAFYPGQPFMADLKLDLLVFPGRDVNVKILQITLFITIFFILFSNRRASPVNFKAIFSDNALWLLLLLSFISILWSKAPQQTIFANLALLVTTVFAIFIATNYSWQDLSGYLVWSITLFAILNTAFPVSWKRSFIGLSINKNLFGSIILIGIITWCFYALRGNKPSGLPLAVIILLIIILFLTNCQTAIMILFVLAALLFYIYILLNFHHKILFLTILFILCFVIAISFLFNYYEYILRFLGRDISITGRTMVWKKALEEIKDNLFLGDGYLTSYEGWPVDKPPALQTFHQLRSNRPKEFSDRKGQSSTAKPINERLFIYHFPSPDPFNPHNGFMALTMDLGLCGLFLFLFSLMRNMFKSVKYLLANKTLESSFSFIILVFLILLNSMETQLLRPSVYWFLYVVCSARLGIDTVSTAKKT